MCYVKSGFMSVQIMSSHRQHRFFLQPLQQHKRVYIEMKGTGNVQCNFKHQNQSSVSFYKVEKLAIFKALFICMVCMQFLTITNLMRLFIVTCAKRPACHMFFELVNLVEVIIYFHSSIQQQIGDQEDIYFRFITGIFFHFETLVETFH